MTGGTWVLYTVLFASYFKNDDIPKAMGIIQLASTIGPFIGMNIGGIVSKLFGYEYSFIVAVIAAMLGLFLLLFINRLGKMVNAMASPPKLFALIGVSKSLPA